MTTSAWATIIVGQSIGLVLLGLRAFWSLRDAVRSAPTADSFDALRSTVEAQGRHIERLEIKLDNGVSSQIKQIREEIAAVRPLCQRHGEELARLRTRLDFGKQ